MHYNPAKGFPAAVVELLYRDTSAAVDWLSRVFGFRESLRWTAASGEIGHADLELDGGIVMVGAIGTHDRSFKDAASSETHAAEPTTPRIRVLFSVSDVDEHLRRARLQGATLLELPSEGCPRYVTRDVEGHEWVFIQQTLPAPR